MTARLEGGRFGPLYTGRDPGGQPVVIRTFADSMTLPQQDVLFERLTRLCSRPIEHASIARALNSGVSGSVPYIVHEALPGKTVDEYLAALGPRPMSDVVERVTALAAAIDFADGCGVHHGALGPRDIAFVPGGSAISGFGLAQALRAARVDTNEASLADDIYALGAMTFELLLGRRYDGGDLRGALSSLEVSPGSLDALVRTLESALSPDPRLWRSSARQFAESLREAADPSAPSAGAGHARGTLDRLALGSADSVGTPSRPARTESKAASLELLFDAPLLLFNAESGQNAAGVPEESPHQASAPPDSIEPPSPNTDMPPIRLQELSGREAEIPVSEPRAPEVAFATFDRPRSSRIVWAMAGVAAVALIAIAVTFLFRDRSAAAVTDTTQPAAAARVLIEEQIPLPEVPADSAPELLPPASTESAAADPAPSPDTRALAPPVETRPDARDAPISSSADLPLPLQGRLLVRSTPAGALVIVDGQPKGHTPAVIRGLEFGVHTLIVKGAGIGSWERQVELTVERPSQNFDFPIGDASEQRAQLAQATMAGTLEVESRPAGAGVWLDGVRVGTTPLLRGVRSGSHAVRIEMPGYGPWITSVVVAGGERARVTASLER